MELTSFHAKYFAHELTRKRSADDLDKLTASLQDAKVDMNPHQVEAALFAFKTPLSNGALLADEVGLGKTIEAGIILSQKWAERNRKLLIIAPANLRKQWSQELLDKFYLPSIILDSKSFNQLKKQKVKNPFENESIVICSYQFANSKTKFLQKVIWDLVIIDEAHRLRNVYKPDNKIANAIKKSLESRKKVLLTATPLQNSLLELYGLVSIIDPYIFGDIGSYRAQFARLGTQDNFDQLKARLVPVCIRTLRRQVLEYIRYTNRIAMVEEFHPFPLEDKLYEQVSEYLQIDHLYALPTSIRPLIMLIMRKLLASSTFAIQGTLEKLVKRLNAILQSQPVALAASLDFSENFEAQDEYQEETGNSNTETETNEELLSPDDLAGIEAERNLIQSMINLAKSINENSKGQKLLTALEKGFEKLDEIGANKKAIIFTESRRTQQYLTRLLELNGYDGKLVLFNGTNSDANSHLIYMQWYDKHKDTDQVTGSVAADTRQALVDYFRDKATIMIATEAAAEGINLQFCSLVVNYDLPWNPQRIEQRIGRCHRYGQKHDVVVINFLNKSNAADQRVYQLLDQKFKLFSGVFGASDEVLGSIESGVDFEQRIAAIYQECRMPEEIQEAFDKLQEELADDIIDKMVTSRQQLLENFDDEVARKLRINHDQGIKRLNQFEQWLWELTRYYLADYGEFDQSESFQLMKNPFPENDISTGKYKILRQKEESRKSETEVADDTRIYRIGHPLAKNIIEACKSAVLPPQEVIFDYSNSDKNISVLENLIGAEGWLQINLLSIESFENEEHLLFAAFTDQGEPVEPDVCRQFFAAGGWVDSPCNVSEAIQDELNEIIAREKHKVEENAQTRNAGFFEVEYDKLEKWVDDMKLSLEKEIKDIDAEIKLRKAEARKIFELEKKVAAQRSVKMLEKKRSEKRKQLYEAQDDIEAKRDGLLDEIEARMHQKISEERLFSIRWKIT